MKKSNRSISKVLARNVTRLRELRGWTPTVLARRLGTSVAKIAAIESGSSNDVRIGVVEALARLFEVEEVELLTVRARAQKSVATGRGRKLATEATGARRSKHRDS